MLLKDPSSADKNLSVFVKKSGFQILNLPSLGARDVLVVPAKQQVGLIMVGNCLLSATNMGNSRAGESRSEARGNRAFGAAVLP